MNIGKYKFNSKEQAQEKIEDLGSAIDEDGNIYKTHNHFAKEIGFEVLSNAVVNDLGEVIEDAIIGECYLVDVIWQGLDDHPADWLEYSVEVPNEGIHGFLGLSYQELKFK